MACELILSCDRCRRGCTMPRPHGKTWSEARLRRLARANGWLCDSLTDLCPQCRPANQPTPIEEIQQ